MSNVNNLGDHAKAGVSKGGPGRPRGSRNRLNITMDAISLNGGLTTPEYKALVKVFLESDERVMWIEAAKLIRHAHRVAPVQGAAK
ncbi:MAG: hypothetical protein ACRCYB_12705 [Aeromonas veronii]